MDWINVFPFKHSCFRYVFVKFPAGIFFFPWMSRQLGSMVFQSSGSLEFGPGDKW